MRFGAHLPTYWNDYGTSNMQTAVVESARAAEALGYDAVGANDFVVGPASDLTGDHTGHIAKPLITLATLVHLTPRIRLGTSVLVLPQRNTFLVAKQAATLDLLSKGRLILGVGVGWLESQYKLLGADFAVRWAVHDQAIEAMQALWCEPVAQYDGRFHRFDDVVMLPKPPQPDGPPIWIGGDSPAALKRAAAYGKAWIPYINDLERFQSGVARLRELTDGRFCPMIGGYFNLRIKRSDEPAVVETKFPWAPISIGGTPDQIAESFEQFRLAGLEYAICLFESESVDDYLRQIRVFAEQIAPQFKEVP